MKKGDIVIAAVLLVSIAGFAFNLFMNKDETATGSYAEITVDGEHYRTVALTEEVQEVEIQTKRGYNLLQISEHGIEMINADCPDKLCIGFGHIHTKGSHIVCLPNRIFVEITGAAGGDGDGLDAVVS
jgi:hypothetical protein